MRQVIDIGVRHTCGMEHCLAQLESSLDLRANDVHDAHFPHTVLCCQVLGSHLYGQVGVETAQVLNQACGLPVSPRKEAVTNQLEPEGATA